MYDQETLDTAVKQIKRQYKRKAHFFSEIRETLKISFPGGTSYRKALAKLVELGLEKNLSQMLFSADSIGEWLALSSRRRFLEAYTKDELIALSQVLKEKDDSWNPSARTKTGIMFNILRNFSEDEISEAVSTSVTRGLVSPLAFGYGYVLGPLGCLESESWFGWEGHGFIRRVMYDFVGKENLPELISALQIDKKHPDLSVSDNLFEAKLTQIIMAEYDRNEILDGLRILVEKGVITVSEDIEIDGQHILTRFGILETNSTPLDNLVEILVSHTDSVTIEALLDKYEIRSSDDRSGLAELCLREKPDFFKSLYGIDQLKRIARNLGMVAISSLTAGDEELIWGFILRKLGFKLPQKPEGILTQLRRIEKIRTEIANLSVLAARDAQTSLVGSMMDFYVICEQILKALVYYYAVLLLREHDYDSLLLLNESIIKKLNLDESLSAKLLQNRLTFGDWIGLLRAFNKFLMAKTTDARQTRSFLQQYSGRSRILDRCSLREIDLTSAMRSHYGHDTGKLIPTVNQSLDALDRFVGFIKCLIESESYPVTCRIVKEIEDEYGLAYYQIEQESGRHRVVRRGWDISPGDVFLISMKGGGFPEELKPVIPIW